MLVQEMPGLPETEDSESFPALECRLSCNPMTSRRSTPLSFSPDALEHRLLDISAFRGTSHLEIVAFPTRYLPCIRELCQRQSVWGILSNPL